MNNAFSRTLELRQRAANSLLCVGLDPDPARIPKCMGRTTDEEMVQAFCIKIVKATHQYACCFKLGYTFFEGLGIHGMSVLAAVIRQIREIAPDVLIIIDRKAGETSSSNVPTAHFIFEVLGADGITIHYVPGQPAMQPFLNYEDKGVFVICRMSGKGSEEFQELDVLVQHEPPSTIKQYAHVARNVMRTWNPLHNCGLVVGATAPRAMSQVESIVPEALILSPGVGRQGGEIRSIVPAGLRGDGLGLLVNGGSDILYASADEHFAEAAAECALLWREDINDFR